MVTDLAERRLWLNKKYLYTHCCNVPLNIEFRDAIKSIESLSKSIDTVYEICKTVKSLQKEKLNKLLLAAQLIKTQKVYTILLIKENMGSVIEYSKGTELKAIKTFIFSFSFLKPEKQVTAK